MPDRIKRILAFLIDWNVLFLPAVLLSFLLMLIPALTSQAMIGLVALFMIALIFGVMALVAARDVIFGGRSLGKRLLRLYVVDRKTLEPIPAGRRFVRNIFFFLINWLEIVLLLATGETLGDRVAAAYVLSRKSLECRREEMTASEQGSMVDPGAPLTAVPPAAWTPVPDFSDAYRTTSPAPQAARSEDSPRKRLSPKVLIPLIIGACVLCIIAFAGIIQLSLSAARNTEQAQLAYDYIVASEAFATAGIAPDDLRMNEYSVNHTIQNGVRSSTAEITFTARKGLFRRYAFYITCHKEGETWSVCEECSRITAFGVGRKS